MAPRKSTALVTGAGPEASAEMDLASLEAAVVASGDRALTFERAPQTERRHARAARTSFASPEDERRFYDLLRRAQDANMAGNPTEAQALAAAAVRIRPHHEAFALLQSFAEAAGDLGRAREYQLLTAFFARDIVLWRELFTEYMGAGELPRAVMCLARQEALETDPQLRRQLQLDRADLLISLGETRQAETIYRRLWSQSDQTDFAVLAQLASLMFQRGRFERLGTIISQSLETQIEAYRRQQEKTRKAEEKQKKKAAAAAAAVSEESDAATKGHKSSDDDDDDEGEVVFDDRGYLTLANISSELLLERGRYAEAVEVIQQSVGILGFESAEHLPPDLVLRLGVALAMSGESDRAALLFRSLCVRIFGEKTVEGVERASPNLFGLRKGVPKFIGAAAKASTRRQRRPDADDFDFEHSSGDDNAKDGAADADVDAPIAENFDNIDPNDLEQVLPFADVFYDGAETLLKLGLVIHADRLLRHVDFFLRARRHLRARAKKEAAKEAALLAAMGMGGGAAAADAQGEAEDTEVVGAEVAVAFGLGRCAAANGDYDNAKAYFERVLKVEPNHAQSRCELASIAARGGDWTRAVSLVTPRAADDLMERVRLHARRADLCHSAGQYVECVTSGLYVLERYFRRGDDDESVATGASRRSQSTVAFLPTLTRSTSVIVPAATLIAAGSSAGTALLGSATASMAAASSIAMSFRSRTVARSSVALARQGAVTGSTYVGSAAGGSAAASKRMTTTAAGSNNDKRAGRRRSREEQAAEEQRLRAIEADEALRSGGLFRFHRTRKSAVPLANRATKMIEAEAAEKERRAQLKADVLAKLNAESSAEQGDGKAGGDDGVVNSDVGSGGGNLSGGSGSGRFNLSDDDGAPDGAAAAAVGRKPLNNNWGRGSVGNMDDLEEAERWAELEAAEAEAAASAAAEPDGAKKPRRRVTFTENVDTVVIPPTEGGESAAPAAVSHQRAAAAVSSDGNGGDNDEAMPSLEDAANLIEDEEMRRIFLHVTMKPSASVTVPSSTAPGAATTDDAAAAAAGGDAAAVAVGGLGEGDKLDQWRAQALATAQQRDATRRDVELLLGNEGLIRLLQSVSDSYCRVGQHDDAQNILLRVLTNFKSDRVAFYVPLRIVAMETAVKAGYLDKASQLAMHILSLRAAKPEHRAAAWRVAFVGARGGRNFPLLRRVRKDRNPSSLVRDEEAIARLEQRLIGGGNGAGRNAGASSLTALDDSLWGPLDRSRIAACLGHNHLFHHTCDLALGYYSESAAELVCCVIPLLGEVIGLPPILPPNPESATPASNSAATAASIAAGSAATTIASDGAVDTTDAFATANDTMSVADIFNAATTTDSDQTTKAGAASSKGAKSSTAAAEAAAEAARRVEVGKRGLDRHAWTYAMNVCKAAVDAVVVAAGGNSDGTIDALRQAVKTAYPQSAAPSLATAFRGIAPGQAVSCVQLPRALQVLVAEDAASDSNGRAWEIDLFTCTPVSHHREGAAASGSAAAASTTHVKRLAPLAAITLRLLQALRMISICCSASAAQLVGNRKIAVQHHPKLVQLATCFAERVAMCAQTEELLNRRVAPLVFTAGTAAGALAASSPAPRELTAAAFATPKFLPPVRGAADTAVEAGPLPLASLLVELDGVCGRAEGAYNAARTLHFLGLFNVAVPCYEQIISVCATALDRLLLLGGQTATSSVASSREGLASPFMMERLGALGQIAPAVWAAQPTLSSSNPQGAAASSSIGDMSLLASVARTYQHEAQGLVQSAMELLRRCVGMRQAAAFNLHTIAASTGADPAASKAMLQAGGVTLSV